MPGETTTSVRASAFGCISIPCLVLALVPLAWGARAQWNAGELARRGDTVTGRVIALRYVADHPSVVEQTSRGASARGESPVVTFTTRTGATRTAVGSVNRQPAPWRIGDAVAIVYDPERPERADLRSEVDGWRLWFGIWCAVAAVPVLIGLVPVWLFVRERRARVTLQHDRHVP
jgi:hypothetical protein